MKIKNKNNKHKVNYTNKRVLLFSLYNLSTQYPKPQNSIISHLQEDSKPLTLYKYVCPPKGEKVETTGSCETEELPEVNRSNDGNEDDLLQTFFPSDSKSKNEDDTVSEVVENAVTPPDETPTVKKAHTTDT